MEPLNIAVTLTCFNRRKTTLACLTRVLQSASALPHTVKVYLVDDGSKDGTGKAVRAEFPEVNILQGTGSLYWNGGMRLAMCEAMREKPDYILWLNDDTLLDTEALSILLETAEEKKRVSDRPAICVGTTRDPAAGYPTYGGVVRVNRLVPTRYRLVRPSTTSVRCDTFNGNIVLLPREAIEAIGNLESGFIHGMGDFDYGHRAVNAGFACWVVPGTLGVCAKNSTKGTYADTQLSFRERWRKLLDVKGLPVKPWYIYNRRHSGPFYLLFWGWPYLKLILQGMSAQLSSPAK